MPDILRQSISYILIALVILTSSTLNIEQRTLKVFFYSYISLVFIGFIMNILFPSFVNLFVLRQSLDVGHRALSSFYSEPAFLCQTVILLGLFMTFFIYQATTHYFSLLSVFIAWGCWTNFSFIFCL